MAREKREYKIGKGKKDFFKCPYCRNSSNRNAPKCSVCGLDFRQLETASNKEARKAMRNRLFGETLEGEIVWTKYYSYDMPKWKVGIMMLFTGAFGGHNILIGKKLVGWLQFALMFVAVALVFTQQYFIYMGIQLPNVSIGPFKDASIDLTLFGSLFMAFPLIVLVNDAVKFLFNSFTIPVKLRKPVDVPYIYNEKSKEK